MQPIGNRHRDADKEINAKADDQPRRSAEDGKGRPCENDQNDPVLDHFMFTVTGLTVHAMSRMSIVVVRLSRGARFSKEQEAYPFAARLGGSSF